MSAMSFARGVAAGMAAAALVVFLCSPERKRAVRRAKKRLCKARRTVCRQVRGAAGDLSDAMF